MERAKFESFVGRFAKFLKPRNRGIESEAGSCERVWALEEIQEVNSADRIDQLNDLRFKMQSGKCNLPRPNSDEISENEMPGMRKEIPKGETRKKYGAMIGQLELIRLGNMGPSWGYLSREFRRRL